MAKLLWFSALLATLDFASATPPVPKWPTPSETPSSSKPPPASADRPLSFKPFIERPISYAALGDGFASGIGSGFPTDNNFDCARRDGSYPAKLLETNLFSRGLLMYNNQACYGQGIEDLDRQIGNLAGAKYDLVTLSVGYHDFILERLPTACVYQIIDKQIPDPSEFCAEAISESLEQYGNSTKHHLFAKKIAHIKEKVLSPNGQLFVTNLPLFFGTPQYGDVCDSRSLSPFDPPVLKMKFLTRLAINFIIRGIDDVIRFTVQQAGPNVHLVDLERMFRRKRFCEMGALDPIGADSPHVFMNDMRTIQDFPGPDLISDHNSDLKQPEKKQKVSFQSNLSLLQKSTLKHRSVFHPKPEAHKAIAQEIYQQMDFLIMDP
ncbi:hypothetical protein PZA11_007643 [Diplocarpon coronariae]|nr:hypothetical protein JHW43_009085 [Diplocarpon mali]